MSIRLSAIRSLLLSCLLGVTGLLQAAPAGCHVSQSRMAEVYEAVRTPYKYGMVVAPATDREQIDCPTVFCKDGRWYMTYVLYNGKSGKDGRGYETWLAASDDLLRWTTLGRILAYPADTARWDACQRGGFPALIDWEWGGSYALQSYKGKNWMTYIGGHGSGYEAVNEPLSIGLAWTDAGRLTTPHDWESLPHPLLSYNDEEAQWWEQMTQYKSTIYWDRTRTLGAPFVMYYNAGGRDAATGIKGERIGIALSKDMKRWQRYAGNPVFAHEEKGVITGDAQIQRMGDLYVMFYFSAFRPGKPYKAYNTFACSYDLVTWDDWQGDDLIFPSRDYDDLFAHKSCVVCHDGVVYHFYCAVNAAGQRGIAVATSRPMGSSAVRFPAFAAKSHRTTQRLTDGWLTRLLSMEGGAVTPSDAAWQTVSLPHTWDDYYGSRQYTHGNLHGTAVYEYPLRLDRKQSGKRYFLYLEGVGSYATVVLNGDTLTAHRPVGRVTCTLDVTDALLEGDNRLQIICEHPTMITDMPWVCGGCSSEWGFSEGSQPLGLYRPVSLIMTDVVRVEPFGVHVWNNDACDTLFVETEIRNYADTTTTIELQTRLNDADGLRVARLNALLTLPAGESETVRQAIPLVSPHRWNTDDPYLYRLLSMVKRGRATLDEEQTPVGLRTMSWPCLRPGDADHRFLLNGKPTFINGTCEYEHLFGASHALTDAEIDARVRQIESLGFNAFRDAHQPHNLRYGSRWDADGVLWWPQFSAHIWYDTPAFRSNFKQLLRQWVRERRNSPALMLWGLQNESTLPADFAAECGGIIREMDPTCGTMRAITTCNGGEGTDWNVVQNWSGTYGGDLSQYGHELARPEQLLNGEYGAWRVFGFHTEPSDTYDAKAPWSEEHFCQLLHSKVMQAWQMRDRLCGQFQWLYASHDNPGRRQPDESVRLIDKVGPYNYKGLLTAWGQPTDAYYMYQAACTSVAEVPMVYVVSHTWLDRFVTGGSADATVQVYSNADSVYLLNAADAALLTATDFDVEAVRRVGITCALSTAADAEMGRHTFRHFDVRANALLALAVQTERGRRRVVASDLILLSGLPEARGVAALRSGAADSLRHTAADVDLLRGCEADSISYLYRINCGGGAYTDRYGQRWEADDTLYSASWASMQAFAADSLNPYLASQGETADPILNVADDALLQSYRFGRHRLQYHFDVAPRRHYRIELYFVEPWWGTGLGEQADCSGYRLFDIAVNGHTVEHDLDIWVEAGHDRALKRVYHVEADEAGRLILSFPKVAVGQAIVSAIAVAVEGEDSAKADVRVHRPAKPYDWAAVTATRCVKTPVESLPADVPVRPEQVYQPLAAEGRTGCSGFDFAISTGLAQTYALRFRYKNLSAAPVTARWQLLDANHVEVCSGDLTFPVTPDKWRMLSTTTGTFVNAGHYTLRVVAEGDVPEWQIEKLSVQ